ncbi:YceI family protein [Puia dinghuensis]|uniref:Polyisoprenoid-binding protein n=1 Tax=Puia dinghuensis TaxID=1792502 RepID=A0A8J2UBE3_9BACT|nr:YceI family protein [Puia dinghuensis]GGA94122.1 polyisoprenoid-binding protein [Puia dinghuensis]
MKKYIAPLAALLLLTGSAFAFIAATNWQIADGYNIAFSSDDAGGIFKGFKGTIAFDEQNPAASKFDVTIDVATVNTGNGLQNKHLKSDEWLDATKYPTIHFVSKSVAKTANGYQVTGDLAMHGVTKAITFPFTFKKTGTGGTFAGSFTVNRNDFKVGKPGGEVGESIKIDVSVPVTK